MTQYKSGVTARQEDFRAEARQDGEKRIVRVIGSCTCEQSGYSLVLLTDTESAPVADELRLRLAINRPPFGDNVETETPIMPAEFTVGAGVQRVVVSILGRPEPIVLAI